MIYYRSSHSLKPTRGGRPSSAFAVQVTGPPWVSSLVAAHTMTTFKFTIFFLIAALRVLVQGCSTLPQKDVSAEANPHVEARVDFNDPVLNSRKILLFGPIDQLAAEVRIQKLLFLDSKGHEPIELF